MSFSNITVTTEKHLVTVTINRPQQRNALTQGTIQELTAAFESIASNDAVRCVLLTGAGTEAFCAGADLNELNSNAHPDHRRAFFNSLASLLQVIRSCPVPVVSAVHGFAFAGGCGLVAASDIAIASDDAVFCLPEVAIGLAPMVVMVPLSRTLSPKALTRMALTGERCSAAEALSAGLVSRLVPKGELAKEALAQCLTITRQSPSAVRATKRALSGIFDTGLEREMHELADQSALVSISEDAVEGIASFLEKRTPRWRSEG